MKKRNFLKSLLLLLSSIPLKLYSNQNQDNPSFDYGVASGDPTNSHVILWTKISKSNKSNIDVKWEVSTENDFTEVLASGTKTTIYSDNFTVKVESKPASDFN